MTTITPYGEDPLAAALRIYSDIPMEEGDAILLLDNMVCLEMEGLASDWDATISQNTARILRETARSVTLAIARPGATPLPSDVQLWCDLHAELRGSQVELQPLRALPAA